MAEEEVKVFRTWSSPFPLRVIWALKLKGVEFDTEYEDLSNKSPLLLQYNPVHKKVPVLLHNGKPICESLVILEYVDETWKQFPLLPQDPHERAKARFWAKFGDDKEKEREEEIPRAMEILQHLEEELKGKKFFGGEKIGLVDLALGWLAYYLGIIEEVIGLKLIDQEKFPLLLQWIQEFSTAPIIQENWPPRDELIAKFDASREAALARGLK
ncbi:hypothetical protein GH714_026711 [Hevea brasiliensis]|uniref:glutathione transferase n=1 Tax=Hevea brasiliensis TaxID=3981 RepID=A0A6A6N617_HEVBR|nr:hypothetical protein GH714_026711 [Hevea brasiliensis]